MGTRGQDGQGQGTVHGAEGPDEIQIVPDVVDDDGGRRAAGNHRPLASSGPLVGADEKEDGPGREIVGPPLHIPEKTDRAVAALLLFLHQASRQGADGFLQRGFQGGIFFQVQDDLDVPLAQAGREQMDG